MNDIVWHDDFSPSELIGNRSSSGIDTFQNVSIESTAQQPHDYRFLELQNALFSPPALLKSDHWNKEVQKASSAKWLDEEGWERPSAKVQRTALILIGSLSWLPIFGDPNLTTSPEGRIVFEWWRGSKKLTLYVNERGFDFIKVVGPDMDTEMEVGYSTNLFDAVSHLAWLND